MQLCCTRFNNNGNFWLLFVLPKIHLWWLTTDHTDTVYVIKRNVDCGGICVLRFKVSVSRSAERGHSNWDLIGSSLRTTLYKHYTGVGLQAHRRSDVVCTLRPKGSFLMMNLNLMNLRDGGWMNKLFLYIQIRTKIFQLKIESQNHRVTRRIQ